MAPRIIIVQVYKGHDNLQSMFGRFILSFPNGNVSYVLCLSLFVHELKLWVKSISSTLTNQGCFSNLHVLQITQNLSSKMFAQVVFQELGVS